MAQDITFDIGTTTAFTITINSVADGSTATSNAVDLGATAPLQVGVHVVLDGASASNTDYCNFYAIWSEDNSAFTDNNNAIFAHAVKMNGTTALDAHFAIPVVARYLKLHFENQSGAGMAASGNSAEYWEMALDQA